MEVFRSLEAEAKEKEKHQGLLQGFGLCGWSDVFSIRRDARNNVQIYMENVITSVLSPQLKLIANVYYRHCL